MSKNHKVLLFDDRLQVRTSLEEKFKENGIDVFPCRTVYEANDLWENMQEKIDVIVLDMMMSSSGLTDGERAMTRAGLLTGWVWLWSALNPNKDDIHPANDKCIVIYTAYYEDFKDYINSEQACQSESDFFTKKVKLIEKGYDNNEDTVVNYVISTLAHNKTKL